MSDLAGNTYRWGKLGTDDLQIKVACFVKRPDNTFNIKMSRSKLVSITSTILSLPLQLVSQIGVLPVGFVEHVKMPLMKVTKIHHNLFMKALECRSFNEIDC